MKKKILIFTILIVFLIPYRCFAKEKVEFSKCVDGDTIRIKINNEERTVRFLAIDTPETKHPKKKVEPFGKEASNYTCNRVQKAKTLELEYDSNSTKEDKYERLLAWVYVDGDLLQDKLVSKGYAKVAYLYGEYKYTDRLKQTEKMAKEKKIGIWGDLSKSDTDDDKLIDKLLDTIYKYIIKKLKSML